MASKKLLQMAAIGEEALLHMDKVILVGIILNEAKHHKPETNSNGGKNEYSDEFEMFWKSYPRKVNKRKSFSSFKGARKKVQFSELMDGVSELNHYRKGGIEFCPHATTWLNGERWNDEIEREQQLDETQRCWFEKFYDFYPKKTNRDDAEAAFVSLMNDGVDPEMITDKSFLFFRSPKGKSKFAPSSANWLKSKWFEDDPSKWNDVEETDGKRGDTI